MSDLRRYWPALGCAFVLALFVLVARPFAEIGVLDDWSYIRTTQIFAATGRMSFNGWATAILGWQVWLGALFIKVFGFSFTAVRASMLPVAMATTFLVQRCFVRFGATEWNATIGTLTVMVSPVMIPLSFTFHTDMTAFFCTMLSLYACLRALRAEADRAVILWLVAASVAGDLGGTTRQIAWLASLVFVPATAWLLRKRRFVPWVAALLVLSTLVVVKLALLWLYSHPYTVPEKIVPGPVRPWMWAYFVEQVEANVVSFPFYVFPLLISFVWGFPWKHRRTWFVTVASVVLLTLYYLHKLHEHDLHSWLVPASFGVVSRFGVLMSSTLQLPPLAFPSGLRMVLTVLSWAAVVVWAASVVHTRPTLSVPMQAASGALSATERMTLLGPFAVLYFVALLPRAMFWFMLDRYLLPLYFIAAVGLVLEFQTRVSPRLPAFSLVVALVFGALGTALFHDLFALERARLTAANELTAAGIQRNRIGAGFEYDAWTQITTVGYVADYRMVKPPKGVPAHPFVSRGRKVCKESTDWLTPAVDPAYYLSYDAHACLGLAQFAPVHYGTWLGQSPTLFVVHAGESAHAKLPPPSPDESY